MKMNAKRILMINYGHAVNHHLTAGLETGGDYEVYVENHAPNALTAALYLLPDLILLDVGMPGMNGREFAEKLSTDTLLQGTPVVFVTGTDSGGADGFKRVIDENILGASGKASRPADFGLPSADEGEVADSSAETEFSSVCDWDPDAGPDASSSFLTHETVHSFSD